MHRRHAWLGFCLLWLACSALPPLEPDPLTGGQPNTDHLLFAASCLQQQDGTGACLHLAAHLAEHPEHLVIRARYAELLLQLHRMPEARAQFEQMIADAQDAGPVASRQVVHGHSRLVEIAEETDDAYAEFLHRGIGLFLLARQRSALPEPDGEMPVEGLLCQAAAQLTLAHLQRPDEARPCWYLYEVWSELGQHQPAMCQLWQAEAAAPFATLTPAERRGLYLAWQEAAFEGH
jgi:hypothetical protein